MGAHSRWLPKRNRRLRGVTPFLHWHPWSFGGRIGTGCLDHASRDPPERQFRGERQLPRAWCSTIRAAAPTRAGEASRAASSTPTWRLGVPCEGSLRDAIRLAALAPANHAARPGRLGMEAGAPRRPPRTGQSLAEAAGRRTVGVNPLAPGNRCGDGPPSLRMGGPFRFSFPVFTSSRSC